MSVYIFKVHLSFNKTILGIFYHRSDGSLKKLQNSLLQRYGVLHEASFKVTWIDNDGDIIRISNDDDLSEFEKLKGTKVFVNAEKDFNVGKIPDPEKPRSLQSLLADLRDRAAKLLVKNLEFEEVVSEEERQFYVKMYPNIYMVANSPLHCTTCSTHIDSATASEKTIRMHPVLRVTLCEKCYTFYNNRDFSQLEYGSEVYCRWCGQGNPVFCCSKCPYVFCRECIVRNLPREKVDEIEKNDNWSCFSCFPNDIWSLRAQHWALVNYIAKTKKKILSEEKEQNKVYELMNKDSTLCCPLTKSVQLKGIQDKSTVLPKIVTPSVQQEVEVQEEAEQSDVVDSPLESEPSVVTPVPVTPIPVTSKANKPLATFGQTCQKPCQISGLPSTSKTVPIPNDQLSAIRQATQSPFYVKLNGVQFDLNNCSGLKTYRLRSGTLVQIEKQTSVNQATNSAKLSGITIRVKANNVFPNPLSTQFNAQPLLKVCQLPSSSQAVPIPNDQLSQTQAKPRAKPCPLKININGFLVDVNEACQQPNYTLPNGKLIRVTKQTYFKQAIPTNSANCTALKVQSGSNNIFPNAHLTQLALPPSIPLIPDQSQPAQTLHDHSHSDQYRLQMSNMRNRMGITLLDLLLKRTIVAINQNTSEIAESRFEHHLQMVRDICKQIEDEVIFQMKAHKSVRNCNEVQELPLELHNELYILYTLSMNYFSRLRDKLANDMKKTHEAVLNQKNECVPVDNDIKLVEPTVDNDVELVEPTTECIVVNSDDENDKSSFQPKSQDVNEATFERDANFKLSTQSVPQTTGAEIDEKLKTRSIVVRNKEKWIEERLKTFMQNESTESVTPSSDELIEIPDASGNNSTKEANYAATEESIESVKEPVKESERQFNIDEKLKSRSIVVLSNEKWIEERLKTFMQNESTGSVAPNSDELNEIPDGPVNNSPKEANYADTKESIESRKEPIKESERQSNIDEKLKSRSIVVLSNEKWIEERLKTFMQNESTGSVAPNSDELNEIPDGPVNNSPKEAIYAATKESIEPGKEPVNESEADANLKLPTLSVPKTISEIDLKLETPSIDQILKILVQDYESFTPISDELIEMPDKSVNNSLKEAVENESIESGKEPVKESKRQSNTDADFELSTTIADIDEKLKSQSIVVLNKEKWIEEQLKAFMQNESTGSVTPNRDESIETPDAYVNNSTNEAIYAATKESIESGKEPVNKSEEYTNMTANESIESEAKSFNESFDITETADESVNKSANKSVDLFKSFEMFYSIESGKESLDAIASESVEIGKECVTVPEEESTTANECIEPEVGSETSFEIAANATANECIEPEVGSETSFEIAANATANECIEPEVGSETSFEIADSDTTIYSDNSPTLAIDPVQETMKEAIQKAMTELETKATSKIKLSELRERAAKNFAKGDTDLFHLIICGIDENDVGLQMTSLICEQYNKSHNFSSNDTDTFLESKKESLDAIDSESVEIGKECVTVSDEETTNATANECIEPEVESETSFEIADNDTTIYLDNSPTLAIDPEVESETTFEIAENNTTTYLDDSESESVYESGKESFDESFEIMDLNSTTIEKSVSESASEGSSINVAESESMNSGNASVIESENKSINATTNESTKSVDESFEILDISGKTNDDSKL